MTSVQLPITKWPRQSGAPVEAAPPTRSQLRPLQRHTQVPIQNSDYGCHQPTLDPLLANVCQASPFRLAMCQPVDPVNSKPSSLMPCSGHPLYPLHTTPTPAAAAAEPPPNCCSIQAPQTRPGPHPHPLPSGFLSAPLLVPTAALIVAATTIILPSPPSPGPPARPR